MLKPILFNTEMVQALLAGKKTQTRRIVKKKYSNTDLVMFTNKYGTRLVERQNDVPPPVKHPDGSTTRQLTAICELTPPFKYGDILWVRETFDDVALGNPWYYKADGDLRPECWKGKKWRPSIHMPREAARLFLKVKDVRLERLHDGFFKAGATILEVSKEGVDICETCRGCIEHYGQPCCVDADGGTECVELDNSRYAFSKIWDNTITPDKLGCFGWSANPWVWVIEFEQCDKLEAFWWLGAE